MMNINLNKFIITGLVLFFLGTQSSTANVYLEPGDSRVFEIKSEKNIDAVFISSPSVADYEIISDNSIVVYANDKGSTDFVIFDRDGNQIFKEKLIVDEILPNIYKTINKHYPDVSVSIERLGSSYILSGTVPSEDISDMIYSIVGEGLGREKTITTTNLVASEEGGSGGTKSTWLQAFEYRGVINKLVVSGTNQVNVKLSVVEVTKEFTDSVGIDWGTITGPGQSLTPGLFRLEKFTADTIGNLIHAIANNNVAKVLAEPNLSVLSGETAEFLVGGEIPIVTSSSNGVNVQFKEYGIKLMIGAKIRDSSNIRVALLEEISDVKNSFATKGGDTFPGLTTRRARTTVELADGDSFLIAGLINQNDYENLSKIPLVGDIPILGSLFRQTGSSRTQKELVVVATVKLVKPMKNDDIVYPDIKATSTMSRLFNISSIKDESDKRRAVNFINKSGFIK